MTTYYISGVPLRN